MTTIDRAIANALTAAAASAAPAGQPEVVIVTVPKESRLESLLCMEEKARDAHKAAEDNWDSLKAAITAELTAMYPGSAAPTKAFEIPGSKMWNPLTVSWREGREYLESSLIKQHIPQVWEAFKKRSRGYWDIRRSGKR
jgi:hypothetical protein